MTLDNQNTQLLLQRLAVGDNVAYDALFAAIYDDLRRRARRFLRVSEATLSTTALVHETYISLAGGHLSLNDKEHFFRLAARAMRRVLIDAARRRNAAKRGEGMAPITLDTGLAEPIVAVDVLALDQALDRLAAAEPRLAKVVELHFFAGLDFTEIARLLDVSERTARRDWRAARALLELALSDPVKTADCPSHA